MLFNSIVAGITCGLSTFYGVGDGFHGKLTASGETFNAYRLTAAHPHLPLGTKLRVTNRANGRQVIVRVNDRGPFSQAKIDLSYGAFAQISSPSRGRENVCWSVVS